MVKDTELGTIEISPNAIATLVSRVTRQTYGVVGMANPSYAGYLAAAITRDPHQGVRVQLDEHDALTIDVYIVVKYGINLASVAQSLIHSIRYHVATNTHLSVKQVNVHVQGLQMESLGQVF